jgi:hypothetical protein
MDLDDLKKVEICGKCKCLYMPEYEEDYSGEYRVNDNCHKCDSVLSEESE